MSGQPFMYSVPAGSRAVPCRGESCPKRVYWIRTALGKPMPVDVDVEGGFPPAHDHDGQGVSHFATCPAADEFRRRK